MNEAVELIVRTVPAPSLATHNGAALVYLVLDDFGSLGRAYRETEKSGGGDRETVITNMLTGQYENPRRVVAFDTLEGWTRDVSQEIADEVLSRACSNETRLQASVLKFVVSATMQGYRNC